MEGKEEEMERGKVGGEGGGGRRCAHLHYIRILSCKPNPILQRIVFMNSSEQLVL